MNRRTFLSNSWKNTGRPILILVGIILAGYGLSQISFTGIGYINFKGIGEFFLALLGIYWKIILLVLSPFILAWIFKKFTPPAYHKAADNISIIALYLILISFIVRIEYNFYMRKQYENMIALVLFVILYWTLSYFQKEKKAPA